MLVPQNTCFTKAQQEHRFAKGVSVDAMTSSEDGAKIIFWFQSAAECAKQVLQGRKIHRFDYRTKSFEHQKHRVMHVTMLIGTSFQQCKEIDINQPMIIDYYLTVRFQDASVEPPNDWCNPLKPYQGHNFAAENMQGKLGLNHYGCPGT